jgi:gliding motility-associated-like protein
VITQLKRIILLLWISCLSFHTVFSQHSTKNNYTGDWETAASWSTVWPVPQTNITSGLDITVNGYITVNGSLSFSSLPSNLFIIDTLVIKGDLFLENNNNLTINDNGILIVRGNLIIGNQTINTANGYFIITGNIIKNGSLNQGSLTSNDNPFKVFIGGTISPPELADNPNFPVLNCTTPTTTPYPNSTCSYGNMTDLTNDPLYTFFQSTCTIATPTITASGPLTFCDGGSVTLTSSVGTSYLWSTGATTANINVTTIGNYSVRVTNSSGCLSAVSAATAVTVNSLPVTPTITAGGPTTFCSGGSVTLTSSAGSTYLWSTGATTASVNVTTAGSYTVRVTNASGCQSASSVATIVTINALPATPTITADGPTTFCAGGSVTLTSSAGTSYLWSNAATTQSINVTAAGSYTVQLTDANGCQSAASAATSVTVNALPVTPTITAGGPTTFCAGGSMTLTSSAGISYLWSNTATTQSINVTTGGSYSVQVTDANGCQSASSVATEVTVNALPATPTITAGGPTTFCSGGSVTLTSSAGTSYLWSNTATTQSINVTAGGSYSVQVTDANGCQSASSVATIVTVNALPVTPTITAGGPTTFCAGGNMTLTSSAGSTYLWSTGATTTSINVNASGSYTVRITNANGCESAASAATAVTVNALPATPAITAGGPTTFCAGGSVTLTSSAGTSYLWSNTATAQSINVTAGGSYSVQITDANGCESAASAATAVTVNVLPATPTIIAGGPTTFCAGGSVTLTSSTGTSYLWSNAETIESINVTIAGSYTVRVTNANGCQSAASAAALVAVNALPATPTITPDGPTTFCAGGSVTLSSSAGTSYLWSNAATTQNINVTTAGSYSVQLTDANGCQSAASAATVTAVNALPIINAGTDKTISTGTSTILNATVTGTGPFTYSWSPSSQLVNALIEDPTTVNLFTTTVFTLTATSTTTSCSNTDAIKITTSGGALTSTPTATPGTICAGADIQLDALASGGSGSYTYTWTSNPVGFTSFIENPTTNPTVNTTYYVAVFDGFTTVNSQVAVTVNALSATPTITASGPTTFCTGGSVTLTSSAGTSYLWSNTATTPNININTAGSYTVQITDANGCQSAASSATSVTVNALPATPTITAGGPTTFCAGGSVTLTSSAGTSYLWSNTAITQSINVTAGGSYSVQITDANGCQSASSVATTVTVNALPATPTITAGGPTTFCSGGSVTLTSSAGTSYLWSNAATTQSINVTAAGSYTVQLTDANGCQSAASAATSVTVNALPVTPTITAGGPTIFCTGGSVTLTSSAGTSYLWSNTATTQSINVTTGGSYSVQVTDANGCQSASSVATIVTVNALPATPTITAGGPTTFCSGGSVTLTSSAGTSYLWSNTATSQSINVTAGGSYSVQVTDANGCQSASSVATIVTVNALPVTPTITAGGPTTFCAGGNVTLTSSAGSTYLWSTGATTTSINVATSGSYTVQVTDANGCESAASAAIAVTVNALPVIPTINAAGPTTFCAGGSVTLTSSAGTSYLWSTGATTQSINVTTAGSYTVLIANANGCQSAASSVATIVTVNALPVTPTITAGGPTTFCADNSVTLTSTAGISYLWSNAATTASITVTTAGSYTVKVMNISGCQSSASAATVVTVNALPATPTITASGPTTFCTGGSVTLTSSAGTSYLWPDAASTASINVATSGSYTVHVTDANGCQSAASAATEVTVNDLPATPTITDGGPTTFCAGGSVTLTSSSGTSYLWSNAATTSSINVTTAGSYTVKVTDANGCKSAASATTVVTVNALPLATASNNGPVCAGSSLNLTGGAAGMTTYSWTGPGGFTSLLQNPSVSANATSAMAGVYYITVTNTSECTSTANTTVTINTLPLVSITSDGSSMCLNDLRTLTGSPAGGIFIISGGPGTIAGNVMSATGTGNIKLEYNYTNVCANKATQSIIVNEKPFAIAGPDQELTFIFKTQMKAELSSSETGEWSVISGSGHISDIHSPTTMVTELPIGENIFLWKVRNGNCEDSKEVKITVYDLFVPSVITPDGDGKNDYFKFSENIGQVELIIFNRWGIEEYTNSNYLNDWDGRNKKGAELPTDTYFYVLKFQNGIIKKGSVLIKR